MGKIDFEHIRPFEPEELPAVYDRLLANEEFCFVASHVLPEMDVDTLGMLMKRCLTNLDFQKVFSYSILDNILQKQSKSCTIDLSSVDVLKRYTFVSNHRDIVLDSAILSKLIIENGFSTTCEVAIGDNLLSIPWVKDVARINKAFIVERSLQPRQMLMASKRMAEYMHYVINEKNDNIWIAQREGRAKDSNDRTQPALLKMMAMGGEGNEVDRLMQLHIAPIAISYEYDPCDYLKACEMQLRRDDANWKKAKGDDEMSMQTGIMGWKGHIHFHVAPVIDEWLDNNCRNLHKTELFDAVAQYIDKQIHSRYKLYPANYVAAYLLTENKRYAEQFTDSQRQEFEQYIDRQLSRIELENKDNDFLRKAILTMYANPLFNKEAAQS